ncbi:Cobyrinic acid ac-diamide synthase [Methanosalsum zhilinae DSM 4017]|uniref:Cobyrinic acid ac-diamide synthase n=1 Tax=Methanosalsum zhilinae (strain DSM 4017 / NBRC 107636 / OCM 62 / WeN5) TaxID=679901 RepID=F7XM83_METZD|nr:carbon monoxide dehydrogenase accessory protein CooC [Methanosalsum zhilinae]AEH60972.1 Cobyrinic acid ac-diamide synthase [Methanosalsum zhilinae DSM 4017]
MFKIAVTGKGGVGKTTLAGTLSRMFARDSYDSLAIDADSDMNLASSIGIKNPPKPLTEYKNLIEERTGEIGGVFKYNPKVDDVVERFGVIGPDGVKMLIMGTVERGGSGCMCPASSFLRAFLRHVILKENTAVILDMEAGIEHLGRGTTRGIDLMIIVVEPGMRSIETASRIKKLSQDIGIKNIAAVVNKGPSKSVKPYLDKFEIPLLGEIPYDPQMVNADLEGLAPIDYGGESVNAIENIKDQVLKMIKHSK